MRATADGVLVVLHDADLRRVSAGRGPSQPIDELTYAQVQDLPLQEPHEAASRAAESDPATVPRLSDVFKSLPGARLNIDLKSLPLSALADIFADLRVARADGGGPAEVRLTSASAAIQASIAEHNRGDVLMGMGERDVWQLLICAYLRLAPPKNLRGRAFQVPVRHTLCGITVPVVTDRVIAYLHAMGCPIHVWAWGDTMVDDPAMAKELFARGIDGVVTNRIQAMRTA